MRSNTPCENVACDLPLLLKRLFYICCTVCYSLSLFLILDFFDLAQKLNTYFCKCSMKKKLLFDFILKLFHFQFIFPYMLFALLFHPLKYKRHELKRNKNSSVVTSGRVWAVVNSGLVKPSSLDVSAETASDGHRRRSSTRRRVAQSHFEKRPHTHTIHVPSRQIDARLACTR